MCWNPLKQCCFLFKHISQRLSRSQTYIKIHQANSSTVRAEVKWRDAVHLSSSLILRRKRSQHAPRFCFSLFHTDWPTISAPLSRLHCHIPSKHSCRWAQSHTWYWPKQSASNRAGSHSWTGQEVFVTSSVLTSVFHVWLLWLCLQSVNWRTVNGPSEVTVSTVLMMS